jgi:hypothetical protein
MRKIFIRHGACRAGITPEYQSWMAMKRRCRHAKAYRSVEVCQRWQTFPPFLEDMGPRPSKKHSIERKDNSKGYSPENCHWGTRKEQARNRRTNVIVEYQGKKISLAEACEITGINYDAAKYRVTVGKLFNQPLRSTAKDW